LFTGSESESADGVQVPRGIGQLHPENVLEDVTTLPQGGRLPDEEIPEGARRERNLLESRQAVRTKQRLQLPPAGGAFAARVPGPAAAAPRLACGHVAAQTDRQTVAAGAAAAEEGRTRFSAPVAQLL